MNEPTIQVRRTAAPVSGRSRTAVLAALYALAGGTAGALWGLWSLEGEGRGFRFASSLEAPRRELAPLKLAARAASDSEPSFPELRVRPIREFRGAASGTGAASSGAFAANRAAASRLESDFAAEGGLSGSGSSAGGSRASSERSTAYAAALAPGRPFGAKARAAFVRRVSSAVAAQANSEARVFRSDSGTAWRLVASNPDAEVPNDLRDAVHGSAYGSGDETETGRRASGREAENAVKLGKIAEAGDGREVAGLESSALLSRIDDQSRRDILRVLQEKAEQGVTGIAACQHADAAAACMEMVRRCEADAACRRRYQGR
ncbi:MAG: hypothetical protein HY925_08435 [Elusimicrobia bacterium]|nr:hypothetical protein [Elusimicrobiota bacterium]